jgi:predicted amidohydrolase YtcJ
VYAPSAPFATALMIDGHRIAWIGEDTAADVHREAVDHVVDLQGAFVTPGFVDAHVHATSTGLLLTGVDLTRTQSRAEAMALVAEFARAHPAEPIIGHGWDETRWSDGGTLERAELDGVVGGVPTYISRIDVHSAIVSTALARNVPGVKDSDGWSETGALSREAHALARAAAMSLVSTSQRERAQRATRQAAASLGIVAVHEMAGPTISSEADLTALVDLSATEPGPLVTGYWGELASTGGVETAQRLGAAGAAGDLFIDGAIGSRTACLHAPYLDAADTRGASYMAESDLTEHLVAVTNAGLQGGFHVIGDAAASMVTRALHAAAEQVGTNALRSAGHRLEHAEMLSDDDISAMVDYAVTASMQPMFDALWGGANGMYEQRLGAERTRTMNRWGTIAGAGGALAFGSDAPVTDLGPWAAVRAAVHHTVPKQRISARAAFSAHTRGGWRAAGIPDGGVLAPGSSAHLAIWRESALEVRAPDERIASWSTDPRSGVPGLPVLDPEVPLPICVATIAAGRVVYDNGSLPWPDNG